MNNTNTDVEPVHRTKLPRFTADRLWKLTDIAVDSSRVALSGFNKRTRATFIDLFTLSDSDSTMLLRHQKPLFTMDFTDSSWHHVSLIDGDPSHILTVWQSELNIYNIHSNIREKHRTVPWRGAAGCVVISEGAIYVGMRSLQVLVFDYELNLIKTITLNLKDGDGFLKDMTVERNNLFISTDQYRAFRYNMEGEQLYQYKTPEQELDCARSITPSSEFGLVFILWYGTHRGAGRSLAVVVYSLSDGHSLFTFDVRVFNCLERIRMSNVNRLIIATEKGELVVYNSNSIFTFGNLKKELSSKLTKEECMELGKYFLIPPDQLQGIVGSDPFSENFLRSIEERGLVHSSNVNRLTEALTELKIRPCSTLAETYMKLRASPETDYDRFLAGLSAHLTLSTPEMLCKYFEFSDEKTKDVTTSQNPGLSLLLTLDEMGFISASDVSKLEAPLAANHLLQAVAKIHEYQSLIAEDSTVATDLSDEDKQKLFITSVQQKTKSWFESMTPVPWKKSCQWKSSDLFVASGLVLTSSVSKTSSRDVDAKSKLHYQDIFTDERLKGKTRIILEGQPGSGKTMLSSQLAYDWSCGSIQDVPIVIYLPLKLVENMTIVQAIKMFYIRKDVPILEDDIEFILANKMDVKIWLILDGLEEYNGRPKEGELSEVMKVMMEEKLPNCNVILTARSDYVKDLPPTPMLKIGSFGEDERNEYIEKIYSDDIERQEAVKEMMYKIPFIAELSTVPLLFVLSVHNIDSLSKLQEQQHNRVTPFVKTIVDVLCPLAENYDSEDDSKPKVLYTLEELAFNGLCRGTQQLMWQKDFVVQYVSNSKEWIDSGILVVEEGTPNDSGRGSPQSHERSGTNESDSTVEHDDRDTADGPLDEIKGNTDDIQEADEPASVTDERSDGPGSEATIHEKRRSHKTGFGARFVPLLVKFLHKLIQEYFAAKHLAQIFWQSSENHDQYQLFREHLAKIDPADLHYVLRFTCHICPPSFFFIAKYLMKEFKTNEGQIPDYIANCICLCFSEYAGDDENAVKDVVKELCETEVISINSDDSPLLLRSKVSMVTYASRSKILLRGLNLTDVLDFAVDKSLRLKYDVRLEILDTLESIEVSRWDQKLKNSDYEDLIKYIANSKCIVNACLLFPSPPVNVKDDVTLQKLKFRNASIEWIIGDKLVHRLDLENTEWTVEFRRSGRPFNQEPAVTLPKEENECEQDRKEHVKYIKEETDKVQSTSEGGPPTSRSKHVTAKNDTEMEPSLSIETTVSRDGGTLEIPGSGVRLEIPPDALHRPELIQMTIIPHCLLEEDLPSFSSNSSQVVELLPSNLELSHPATLTLPHCLQLNREEECTAVVYSSCHQKGDRPLWVEMRNTDCQLENDYCTIKLRSFSWKTYKINNKRVKAKKIKVYAARSKDSTDMETKLDIGWHRDLAGENEILQTNDLELLEQKPFLFRKKGSVPLQISFEEVDANAWHNLTGRNKKDIPFDYIASSVEFSCPFILQKNVEKKGRRCHFTAKQNLEIELAFLLKNQSTRSPSLGDSQLAAACGGSSLVATTSSAKEKSSESMTKQNPSDVVTTETLKTLSKKIGEEWKAVGRNLDLKDPDLYKIKVDHKDEGHQEIVYQMLLKWKRNNGCSATIRVLAEALKEPERKDLHDELIVYEREKSMWL